MAKKKKEINENLEKIKVAYEQKPVELIDEDYYAYLMKETGLTKKECYTFLLEYLSKNKF